MLSMKYPNVRERNQEYITQDIFSLQFYPQAKQYTLHTNIRPRFIMLLFTIHINKKSKYETMPTSLADNYFGH